MTDQSCSMTLTHLQNDGDSPSKLSTPLQEFYTDAKILITGGTGFLGRALAEKLLRSCHNIDTIYYLVRTKRGAAASERHEKLLTSSVFEKIHNSKPDVLKKLIPVAGDVSEKELGLSLQDRKMLVQNVNVVFHAAATIRFNERIDSAFKLNTVGTIKVLKLCKNMKNFKAFVHVSTAYSNCDKSEIKEEVCPSPAELEKILEIMKIGGEEEVEAASLRALQGKHPNTYTLTKALAEIVVNEHARDIPVCIVRPSIVGGALSEPMPGWAGNFSGTSGIMVEIGRGTIKSFRGDGTKVMDVIPVDLVVNTLITAGWRTGIQREQEKATVYNCTSGTLNPILWHKYGELTLKHGLRYPSIHIMFYPSGFRFRTNVFVHWFVTLAFQVLPAIVLDTFLFLTFKKTFAYRYAQKCIEACQVLSFFSHNEWNFQCDNMLALQESLSKDACDAEAFPVDVRKLNWDTYIENYIVGLRRYALRDPLSTLPAAKRKQIRIWWVSTFFNAGVVSLLAYGGYCALSSLLR